MRLENVRCKNKRQQQQQHNKNKKLTHSIYGYFCCLCNRKKILFRSVEIPSGCNIYAEAIQCDGSLECSVIINCNGKADFTRIPTQNQPRKYIYLIIIIIILQNSTYEQALCCVRFVSKSKTNQNKKLNWNIFYTFDSLRSE